MLTRADGQMMALLFLQESVGLLAVVLSVPLTILVGKISGEIFLETPLTIAYSPPGMGVWLGLVIVLSAVAGSLPALRATELPVNEVLAYE